MFGTTCLSIDKAGAHITTILNFLAPHVTFSNIFRESFADLYTKEFTD